MTIISLWGHPENAHVGSFDASNLLQYAIHNYYSYHCLYGSASRGLHRLPEAQLSPDQGFRNVPQKLRQVRKLKRWWGQDFNILTRSYT